MNHSADGDNRASDVATDREFNDAAQHASRQSIEPSVTTVVAPITPPDLTPEAAVVLARIIQALTRDTRHHRAA